jgi:hypothetical protein
MDNSVGKEVEKKTTSNYIPLWESQSAFWYLKALQFKNKFNLLFLNLFNNEKYETYLRDILDSVSDHCK